ncbi:hypothetical protein SNE40_021821 [Patella caerulea]|uniref:Thiamine transporter SLC35F3 n=1 Tax=Patella caerulea TaxID=87958 RepID=A0AAN8G0B5_PATCE
MASIDVEQSVTEVSDGDLAIRRPVTSKIILPSCECTDVHKKSVLGVLLAIAIAIAWSAFTQITQNAYIDEFRAPFFLTYLCTIWLIPFYPVYFIINHIKSGQNPRMVFRESILIYADNDNIKKVKFMGKTFMFCFVWTLATFTYIKASSLLGAADITALQATNHSFVYMLSWIVLFEKFVAIRILALVFSITGIVLFAYVDGFGSEAMWGVVVAVASSAGAAVYRLLMKKFVGCSTVGQASLFLSLIGFLHTACLWPIILLLYFTKVEVIIWSSLPWQWISPSILLFIVHQILVNFVVKITYPVFTGLGLAFGIPFSAVADTIWRHKEFSGMKIAALVLITLGLLLILLPDNWEEVVLRPFKCKNRRETAEPVSSNIRSRMHRTTNM